MRAAVENARLYAEVAVFVATTGWAVARLAIALMIAGRRARRLNVGAP